MPDSGLATLDGAFDAWYRAAREKAEALHLDEESLVTGHSLVLRLLGDRWIHKQETEARRDRAFHELHPLYVWLRSSAEVALVEVAEIAKYLASFENDPALEDVLAHLRTKDDFEPTLFELAMAYRWKRTGDNVTLAPSLPTGKVADFAAEVAGIRYIVEVSASPRRMTNPIAASFAKSILKAIRAAGAEHEHLAVELVVTSRPQGDLHGAVQRTVRTGIRDLKKSDAERKELSLAFGKLVVRKTPSDRNDDAPGPWHHEQQLMLQKPPEDGTGYDAHKQETVGRGCAIYVRLPPDSRDLYDLLLAKFNKERRQLASVENRVVLLDASGVKSDPLTMDMDRVNDTIGQELLHDEATSAAWIASRGYSEYLRPMYRVVTMSNTNATHPLPAAFGEQMSNLEEREDILTGRPFDWEPRRRFEDPI